MTQELVNSIFEYKEGKLFWKIKPANHINIGDEAGTINKKGYKAVGYNYKIYRVSRLIFLMHYGYMPKEVDHKDRNRLNNNIENLRAATTLQNHANKSKRANTTSRYRGVVKRKNKWYAAIITKGKSKWLGSYDKEIDAAEAYNKAAFKIYGEFASLNIL